MKEFIALLQSIPSQAWIVLMTAILTSAITLLSVWLTNRANYQRLKIQLDDERIKRNEEHLRDHLEELYVASNKFLDMQVTRFLPYRAVMMGQISYDQALDMALKNSSQKDFEPHRVTMLIDLYFSSIKPSFQEIIDIRNKLNEIIEGHKEQYKSGNTDGSKWLELFQPLYEEFAKKADAFSKVIINLKRHT
jgi:hypothetical protein